MSNTLVGATYKHIIDKVVDSSRTDFEENGVPNNVLEMMKQKWQDRLTSLGRADFPWDEPKHVDPVPKAERNADHSPSGLPQNGGTNANGHDTTPIKQETFDQNYLSLPPRGGQGGIGSQYASQRAAHLMQQQFGSQANGSISAMQAAQQMHRGYGNTGQQQQTYNQYPQQSPYANTQQQQQQVRHPQSYSQQRVQQPQQQQQPRPDAKPYIKDENDEQRNGIGGSQLDGIADMVDEHDGVIAFRDEQGVHRTLARVDADNTIRSMIEHSAKRREGGGLMLPLSELKPTRPLPKWASPSSSGRERRPYGGDAPEDEDDEDAINSDLDDPDDPTDANLEGEYEGDVVLCLYDKVQRVKNKWKCTLREGILTIDQKDYLFHKANGEFEW